MGKKERFLTAGKQAQIDAKKRRAARNKNAEQEKQKAAAAKLKADKKSRKTVKNKNLTTGPDLTVTASAAVIHATPVIEGQSAEAATQQTEQAGRDANSFRVAAKERDATTGAAADEAATQQAQERRQSIDDYFPRIGAGNSEPAAGSHDSVASVMGMQLFDNMDPFASAANFTRASMGPAARVVSVVPIKEVEELQRVERSEEESEKSAQNTEDATAPDYAKVLFGNNDEEVSARGGASDGAAEEDPFSAKNLKAAELLVVSSDEHEDSTSEHDAEHDEHEDGASEHDANDSVASDNTPAEKTDNATKEKPEESVDGGVLAEEAVVAVTPPPSPTSHGSSAGSSDDSTTSPTDAKTAEQEQQKEAAAVATPSSGSQDLTAAICDAQTPADMEKLLNDELNRFRRETGEHRKSLGQVKQDGDEPEAADSDSFTASWVEEVNEGMKTAKQETAEALVNQRRATNELTQVRRESESNPDKKAANQALDVASKKVAEATRAALQAATQMLALDNSGLFPEGFVSPVKAYRSPNNEASSTPLLRGVLEKHCPDAQRYDVDGPAGFVLAVQAAATEQELDGANDEKAARVAASFHETSLALSVASAANTPALEGGAAASSTPTSHGSSGGSSDHGAEEASTRSTSHGLSGGSHHRGTEATKKQLFLDDDGKDISPVPQRQKPGKSAGDSSDAVQQPDGNSSDPVTAGSGDGAAADGPDYKRGQADAQRMQNLLDDPDYKRGEAAAQRMQKLLDDPDYKRGETAALNTVARAASTRLPGAAPQPITQDAGSPAPASAGSTATSQPAVQAQPVVPAASSGRAVVKPLEVSSLARKTGLGLTICGALAFAGSAAAGAFYVATAVMAAVVIGAGSIASIVVAALALAALIVGAVMLAKNPRGRVSEHSAFNDKSRRLSHDAAATVAAPDKV